MNDIDLATALSPESGNFLTEAKEAREDYPRHCLVTLRGLCNQICLLVIKAKELDVPRNANLVDLINTINEKLKPDQPAIDALHALRRNGNQGAHPEEFQGNTVDMNALTVTALEDAVTALKFAHTQIHTGKHLPDHIEVARVMSGLKTLSYKAAIEEQPEAQYLLGEHFREKAKELERQSNGRFMFGKFDAIRRNEHFWYESAANHEHPQAKYEYGRLLIDDMKREGSISKGVRSVFGAAEMGNADANLYVGRIFYEGLHDYEQDFVEARKHLELAAREDHPAALMLLGVMFERGEGGPANPRAALEYTRRSAEAGYPTGQNNLASYYWNQPEPNTALTIYWLNKAAEQGYPPSLNTLAELIAAKYVDGKMPQDAIPLFEKSINSSHANKRTRSEALLGLARVCASLDDDLAKLTGAANCLQRCFEAEQGSGEIAQACSELAPTVLSKINKLIQECKGTAEELTTACIYVKYMFDKNERPVVSRDIADQKMYDDCKDAARAKEQLSPELYQARLTRTFLPELASRSEQQRLRVVPHRSEKTGRNDSCPCGSGKKFKRCCEAQ